MSNSYLRPWENSNTDWENDEVSENSRSTVAVSEEMQKAVFVTFAKNMEQYM